MERGFQPGFRLSKIDVGVLIAGAAATVWGFSWEPWFGGAVAIVVMHFFLFCNVFRISRPPELVWSALFVALCWATIVLGKPSWPVAIAVTLLATMVVVVVEMRRPSYHGVGWRRINPQLEAWWKRQADGAEADAVDDAQASPP